MGEFYRDAAGRELHYIEVHADEPIADHQDPTTLGWTMKNWLANNERKPIGAYIDDHHNHTPVGEILHTFETRDSTDSSRPMLGAGAVIFRHLPKGRELSDRVARGEIKTVSIDYQTEVDPLTQLKLGQKLVAVGLHSNPHNRKCVITRQRGEEGASGQGGDLYQQLGPGIVAAQHHPTFNATKVEELIAALCTRQASQHPMADNAAAAAAAAPVAPPAAPSASSAAVVPPPAVQQPAAAATTSSTTATAPQPMEIDTQHIDPTLRTKLQEKIKTLAALKPEQMMAEAAKSLILEEKLAALKKEADEKEARLGVFLTREQEAQKKQFEERMAEITKLTEPLKTLGFDLGDAEVKKEFEEHARGSGNKFVQSILNNAKTHVENQAKAAEVAKKAEQEALEKQALANVYGWDRLQRAEKAVKQETAASPANPSAAPVSQPTAAQPAQVPPQPQPQQQMQQQQPPLHPLLNSQLSPAVPGPLAMLRADIDGAFSGLARANADLYSERLRAVRSEERLGSQAAQKFEMLQAARTTAPISVKQGADGGLFTGQLLNVQAPVQAYEVVSELATSGRWRDLNAAAVLACDGKTFRNPYTGNVFPMQELLDLAWTDSQRRSEQVWNPEVAMACAANMLSAGLGDRIPWINRDRQDGYNQHIPTRKVPGAR